MQKGCSIRENIIWLSFFLLLGGVLGVILKYEMLWDFTNYHYFNPWAFLNDRINYDVGVAGMNAFFNPLPDIPLYLLIKYFNDYPNFICFMQGLWFGVLLFLFFKISCQIVDTSTWVGKLQVFVILLVGTTGWSTFMQIGTSSNEVQISVFIMAGLYVLLKEMYAPKQNKWLFLLSGLLLGAAMGLKLTAVTYCVSSALAVFLYYRRLERPLEKIFFFAVGGIGGFLIFNGFWMYILWAHFQNPFFPFANEIFKSEYASVSNFRDARFVPQNVLDALLNPFLIFNKGISLADNGSYAGEGGMFIIDYRLPMAYFCLSVLLIVYLKDKLCRCKCRFNFTSVSGFLLVWGVVSYIIWMLLFNILRYSIPFDMLSAILIVSCMFEFCPKREFFRIIYIVLCNIILFSLCSTPYFSMVWGTRNVSELNYDSKIMNDKTTVRFSNFSGEKFVFMEDVDIPDNALVYIYEYPAAAVLPYWYDIAGKKNIRGVLVHQLAYFTTKKGVIMDYYEYNPKWKKMKEDAMSDKDRPIIAVSAGNTKDPLGVLQKMYCRQLPSNLGPLTLCVPHELKDKVWKRFFDNSKKVQDINFKEK